jgi:hypothetical protein
MRRQRNEEEIGHQAEPANLPKSRQPVKPTLFVIFAKKANEAVIFRRGPSAWFHLIRWNALDDSFEHGAWFKGRIYPERCDLSPNGELLLCFMHQGNKLGTTYEDSWTAISRSPWLNALWLLPQGTTYAGGGRFTDDRSLILRHIPCLPTEAHPNHPGIGLNISFQDDPAWNPFHASSEEVEGADWSGRDQSNRLVYTTGGRLFLREQESAEDRCLGDFTACVPEPVRAPESALAPLPPLKRTRGRSKGTRKLN